MDYSVRTIRIPVAQVIAKDGLQPEGKAEQERLKSEFYKDLRDSLDVARRAANKAITDCVKQDDLTQTKAGKLYSYPAISNEFPGVAAVAATISASATSCYIQNRFHMINGSKSIRLVRSHPWPLLCNKSTKHMKLSLDGEFCQVTLRLLGSWWTVRLAGGSAYRDQVRGLRNALQVCDSSIWKDKDGKAVLGIVIKMAKRVLKDLSGTMSVSTSKDSFLVGSFERSSVPFVINGDECLRWKAESNRRMQRLRQDRKSDANKRVVRSEMARLSVKSRDRFKTFCHQAAKRIVDKAARCRVATIRLDFTIKSYIPQFPWFELVTLIKQKANAIGIDVIEATQTVIEPNLDGPHIYFVYDPSAHRVKIGKTIGGDGRLGSYLAFCPDAVVLAIDNQSKSNLTKREKHWHAYFDEHRVTERKAKGNEVFAADPVIAFLREADWLGNAGNLSQIMQVLDASTDAVLVGHLQADRDLSQDVVFGRISHNAVSVEDIALQKATALEVTR